MTTKEQAQAALDELASLAHRDASEPDFVIDSWKKTIRAALEAMAGDGWRPINTLPPKTKQTFLVDCPTVESDMTLAILENAVICSTWDGRPFIGFRPTHWMPLPPEPKGQDDD